jgi:hypothetical protein
MPKKTELHNAIREQNVEKINKLLNAGLQKTYPALCTAIKTKNHDIIRIFLDNNVDNCENMLWEAVCTGDPDVVRIIGDKDPPIHLLHPLKAVDMKNIPVLAVLLEPTEDEDLNYHLFNEVLKGNYTESVIFFSQKYNFYDMNEETFKYVLGLKDLDAFRAVISNLYTAKKKKRKTTEKFLNMTVEGGTREQVFCAFEIFKETNSKIFNSAIRRQDIEILKTLIDRNVKPDKYSLNIAFKTKNKKIVEIIDSICLGRQFLSKTTINIAKTFDSQEIVNKVAFLTGNKDAYMIMDDTNRFIQDYIKKTGE